MIRFLSATVSTRDFHSLNTSSTLVGTIFLPFILHAIKIAINNRVNFTIGRNFKTCDKNYEIEVPFDYIEQELEDFVPYSIVYVKVIDLKTKKIINFWD